MNVMRCMKCTGLYPDDMENCPTCGYSTERNAKHLRPAQNNTTTEYNTPTKSKATLAKCTACGCQISTRAESCPQCGNPTGVHVCPKCGSTNTKIISGVSKAASTFLWGPFAINKVMSKFQCKDCWHKF